MDFKPFKKDRKPGPDGHYDWESPGLRARIDEARRNAKPLPTKVPFEPKNWADQAMINRDESKAVMLKKQAEDKEQAAFEKWIDQTRPSGDGEQVQRLWNEVREEWMDEEETSAESVCSHKNTFVGCLGGILCKDCGERP